MTAAVTAAPRNPESPKKANTCSPHLPRTGFLLRSTPSPLLYNFAIRDFDSTARKCTSHFSSGNKSMGQIHTSSPSFFVKIRGARDTS